MLGCQFLPKAWSCRVEVEKDAWVKSEALPNLASNSDI
jgi:hypothetical protein